MADKYEVFAEVFRDNIGKRSRTAKGVSDVASTPGKKKLLAEGEALTAQVRENTDKLINTVWGNLDVLITAKSGAEFRPLMESWHDIINYRLQPVDAYAEQRRPFMEEAERLRKLTGENYRINPRYRLAIPKYLIEKGVPTVPIVDLEFQMDQFYDQLFESISLYRQGALSGAGLLGIADMFIDGEIHPWLDGCGRMATATVMWLSASLIGTLPVFGDRDEHYRAIKANKWLSHISYYQECLERGQAL